MISGEHPLVAFVSSVMSAELKWARDAVFYTLIRPEYLTPWLFERTPASSESADKGYLRKVRESDLVLWLIGRETTRPVQAEIREAIANRKPLLCFKLPAKRRTFATTELINEVGLNAKWTEVTKKSDFVRTLELTLGDEIIRSFRATRPMDRFVRLEETGALSRGRCISRWHGAGVPFEEAVRMVDDPSIGNPTWGWRDVPGGRPRVIVGDFGSGKSLVLERLFQAAVGRARNSATAPIPVYAEAKEVKDTLSSLIEARFEGFADSQDREVLITIDGLDEVGATAAQRILDEARVLAAAYSHTKVVIATRPLMSLSKEDDVVQAPELSQEQSLELIGRVSRRDVSAVDALSWPPSVRDAMKRPLFAILLGGYIKDRRFNSPETVVDLIRHLVDQALARGRRFDTDVERRLVSLAGRETDRGGPIPIGEVATTQLHQEALLASGLVAIRDKSISFSLPILTQWFAALSLVDENAELESICSDRARLERWLFPITIAISISSQSDCSRILSLLTTEHAAFASVVLNDVVPRWHHGGQVSLPTALQKGAQLREAMAGWVKGLGPIGELIAPLGSDGQLRSIGVRAGDGWLTTSWYLGRAQQSEVILLPPDVMSLLNTRQVAWGDIRTAQVGNRSAWAWQWTHEELSQRLSQVVGSSSLWVIEPAFINELNWSEAQTVSGVSTYSTDPIDLDVLWNRLDAVSDGADATAWNRQIFSRARRLRLKGEVARLRLSGLTELFSPWPGPDQDNDQAHGWMWSGYGDEGLLRRTREVFAGAIDIYRALVQRWFPTLSERMPTWITLPAELVGTVQPARGHNDYFDGPAIMWSFEPLPIGSESTVRLELGQSLSFDPGQSESSKRFRRLRPEASGWLGASVTSSVLDIWGARPATAIAYHWLRRDLHGVSWVDSP